MHIGPMEVTGSSYMAGGTAAATPAMAGPTFSDHF